MPLDLFLTLLMLAIAALFTPGPNNAMLAASGARFGLRPTLPHMMGVAWGFAAMALIVGLFLGQLYQSSEILRQILRFGGAALLLWVAWQIARSGEFRLSAGPPRPMRFWEAVAFQWVNPKAWAMATGIAAQFIHADRMLLSASIVFATFALMGVGSATFWTALGRQMARFLTSEPRRVAFNLLNAGLILLAVVAILLG